MKMCRYHQRFSIYSKEQCLIKNILRKPRIVDNIKYILFNNTTHRVYDNQHPYNEFGNFESLLPYIVEGTEC